MTYAKIFYIGCIDIHVIISDFFLPAFFPPAFYDKIVVPLLGNTNGPANADVPQFESFLPGDILITNQSQLIFSGKVSIGTNYSISAVYLYNSMYSWWVTNTNINITGPTDTKNGRNYYNWSLSNSINFSPSSSNYILLMAVGSTGKQGLSATNTILVDSSGPNLNVNYPPFNTTFGSPIYIYGGAYDYLSGLNSVIVSIDGGLYYPAAIILGSNFTFTADISSLTQGSHYFSVTAFDKAGNSNFVSGTPFIFDNTLPSIIITSPIFGAATTNSTIAVTGTADIGNASSISSVYVINANSLTTNLVGNYAASHVSFTATAPLMPNMNNQIQIMAISSSGRTNLSSFVTVLDDQMPPNVTFNNVTNGQVFTSMSSNITGNVSDNLSGVKAVYLSVNGGPYTLISTYASFSYTLQPGGYSSISVYAVDNAGNASVPITVSNVSYISALYVSPSGNDNNSGVKTSPFFSIQRAVDLAAQFGIQTIYVAQGTYKPGTGLNIPASSNDYSGVYLSSNNNNLSLYGGYDTAFSSRPGLSVLDGQLTLTHVVELYNNSGVRLDGFVLCNGKASGTGNNSFGGGLFLQMGVSYSTVTNCVISNNNAVTNGGGVYVGINSYNNNFYGEVCYNQSAQGGGMFMNSSQNYIYGKIHHNTASDSGGGLYLNTCSSYSLFSSVYNNSAVSNGGGAALYGCFTTTLFGSFTSNSAGMSGGGVYFFNASSFNFYSTNSYNTAKNGGSLYSEGGSSLIFEGIHSYNISSNSGSALYIVGGNNSSMIQNAFIFS